MAGPLDSLIANQGAFPAPGAISLPQPVINPVQPVAPRPSPTPAAGPLGGGFDMGSFVDRNMSLEGTGPDPRSSAVSGFMPDTWLAQVRKIRPDLAGVPDGQVLAMRNDPSLRRQAWASLAQDNAASLTSAGFAPSPTNLRLANWFGAGGAQAILSAPDSTPIESLNFGKMSGATVVAANPTLAGKTVGEVKAMVDQQMSGVGGFSLDERARAIARVQADKNREAAGLDKTASAAIKNIGEMQGDLAKTMERVRAAQDKADAANDAAKAAITKAPPQPDINGFKQLNGLAVLVGVLGGLFTKSPMRTSINAAASAIEAYNDHDREAYETAYRNWHTQTDLLFKISDMTQNRVKDILYAENMGFNEKNALLDTTLRAAGLEQLANSLRTQGDMEIQKWMEDTHAATEAQRLAMKKEQDAHDLRIAMLGVPKNDAQLLQAGINQRNAELVAAGQPPMDSKETYDYIQSHPIKQSGSASAERAMAVKKLVDDEVEEYKSDHPNATKAEIDRAEFDARVKHEKEMAEATGRPARSPSALYMQRWMEEHPGASSDQISRASANYTYAQTVERAFGTGPTSRNVQALNTVADHINTVRKYAALLNNGDVVRANALLNTLKTEVGWAGATNFETAADIMADEVVRLLTSTGGSETDRRKMESHFSQNRSPAQIGGALDAAENMVSGRFKSLEQSYAGNDPARRQYFEASILTPDAREMFVRNKDVAPSGNVGEVGAGDHPPRIQNGWRYEWQNGQYQPVSKAP